MTETMWTCCDDEIYDHAGIMAHLQGVHGLNPPIQAVSSLVQCLDGPGWALNTFEVRITEFPPSSLGYSAGILGGELLLHRSVKTENGDGRDD